MKIAITGANGFLGRHVTRSLLQDGHEPVVMVRNGSAMDPAMEPLRRVLWDLHDTPQDLYERCESPDLLIHLAWSGLPNFRSLHHFETELHAQYHFLRSMVDAGLSKMVVTGTCFEYGMQSGPLHEDLHARPSNPYGFAKHSLLTQLMMLRHERAFDLTWTRLFYLYGEGQAKSSLYSQLQRAVADGSSEFPMSHGEQLRDFMPVERFRNEFKQLALTPGSHGVVNLCSGEPVSVRALVERWIRENSWDIRPKLGHYPYPDYEPMAFWGVRDKLDSILSVA